MKGLDKKDIKILRMLQENARVSNSDIAKKTKMAPSGTIERVRRLLRLGIIREYRTLFDVRKLGLDFLALTAVKVQKNWSEGVAQALLELPYVQEVHEVAGEYSYFVKILCRDREHFSEIMREDIGKIDGIIETKSNVVLRTLKEDPAVPLEDSMVSRIKP
ncbi:MAG: Lrp/AsnC family transcriptional regulator [bacterium]|nr:Lrp/AsnC family transcriptional regulator [bacterium]